MLSVEHVTKTYGKFTALEDISLTFTPGVYGLLAPNGAGKTTLIKMLTTLLFPTKGQILWEGEDIRALGAEYRGLLGYLPQQFGYYPSYTPRQFLRYAAALQCIPKREADGRIDHLLETVGLGDAADKKMKKFSGGMLQRVGIAVAMLNDPKLLILDEPTAGLDPRERVRLRNVIATVALDKVVIWTTHIVSDIEFIARDILMLKSGQLIARGTPQELVEGMQGKVFTLPVQPGEVPQWQDKALVGNVQRREGDVLLRIVADECPGGLLAAPDLEDVYLYHFQEVSREGER